MSQNTFMKGISFTFDCGLVANQPSLHECEECGEMFFCPVPTSDCIFDFITDPITKFVVYGFFCSQKCKFNYWSLP